MVECKGCAGEVDKAIEGLCETCRDKLGLLLSELPVQRPAGPCSRCSGREIIQSLLRERGAEGSGQLIEFLRPLAITHGVEDTTTFWSGRKDGVKPNLGEFYGALVAYACRSCGFTELYTLGPGQIPIGPEHGTRLLEADDAPYR